MKDIDQSQESSNVYKIRKLLKKIRIRIDRRIRNSYTTNKKKTEVTIRTIRRKNVLVN